MKPPINSLKHKLKGLSPEEKRVESGLLKPKPINTQARRIVAPRPYWADPIPEKAPSVESLQLEIKALRETLSAERKEHGAYVEKAERKLAEWKLQLSRQIQESTATISALKQQVEWLEKRDKRLKELEDAISNLHWSVP